MVELRFNNSAYPPSSATYDFNSVTVWKIIFFNIFYQNSLVQTFVLIIFNSVKIVVSSPFLFLHA